MIWGLPGSQLAGPDGLGEGRRSRRALRLCPPVAPCTPPGHGDCFRLFQGAPESRPHPCLAAVPQLPCPTPKTAGREVGVGSRAQLLGSGWDPGGEGHERARAGGGGGRRKPSGGCLPAGPAHLGHRNRCPPSVGWGKKRSGHPALPGKGSCDRLSGKVARATPGM